MLMNLLQESTKNLASQSCGGAMRTIAPSMPSHDCPGSAAGGPRRGFVPQAPTVKICVSGGAPLHRESRIYEHSEQARAPHTSGPRDVPRCGALSLLQKDAALQGGSSRNRCRLNVKLRLLTDCVVPASFFTAES